MRTLSLIACATALAGAAAQPTFRTSTRLIEVTVVVQDSDHKPISGLTRDDFTLLDEGKPQNIELFSVEADAAPRPAAPPAAEAPSMAGLFTNRVDAQKTGAITVILLDRVNSQA